MKFNMEHFLLNSEILGAMQDPDAGVNLGSHVRNGAVHKNCFTGNKFSINVKNGSPFVRYYV